MSGNMDIRDLKVGGFPLYFDKETLKRPEAEYKKGRMVLDDIGREKKISEREDLQRMREEQEKQKFLKALPED
jgi:hypothetical protein